MNKARHNHRRQLSPVFAALLLFELVLVMLQLWLFASVLESTLAGRHPNAVAAMIASFVCLGINAWMLVGIEWMDHAE